MLWYGKYSILFSKNISYFLRQEPKHTFSTFLSYTDCCDVVQKWIQLPECTWRYYPIRFLLEPSTRSQPMKFKEAGFWNETLQYPSSVAPPWTSLSNWAKFLDVGDFFRGWQTLLCQYPFSLQLSSVIKFMTVADRDTLALIMPVRAQCCTTTGSACPSSASLVPPAPINTHQPGVATSLLYSGSQFRGYQKSKGNSYDVEVVLQVTCCWH